MDSPPNQEPSGPYQIGGNLGPILNDPNSQLSPLSTSAQSNQDYLNKFGLAARSELKDGLCSEAARRLKLQRRMLYNSQFAVPLDWELIDICSDVGTDDDDEEMSTVNSNEDTKMEEETEVHDTKMEEEKEVQEPMEEEEDTNMPPSVRPRWERFSRDWNTEMLDSDERYPSLADIASRSTEARAQVRRFIEHYRRTGQYLSLDEEMAMVDNENNEGKIHVAQLMTRCWCSK